MTETIANQLKSQGNLHHLAFSLNRRIDHTNLKPTATKGEIERLCEEASRFHFRAVCVHPCWVKLCAEKLLGMGALEEDGLVEKTRVCTVVGFPLGASSAKVKAFEIQRALEDGAQEIDLVINVGLYLSTQTEPVQVRLQDFRDDFLRSIEPILCASSSANQRPRGLVLKVIIETCLLTADHISELSAMLSSIPEVGFIKTSTGFNGAGANAQDVALIRKTCVSPGRCQIKASGGIKSLSDCIMLIEAGAWAIGTSSGCKIMEECQGYVATHAL